MDRKLIPTQLELIRVTMRRESSRLAPVAMAPMRSRAFAILDKLEAEADGDHALLRQIAALRDEI
jgi:hypothetical protein